MEAERILHLRCEHVDLERGLIFMPDSKSGRKAIIGTCLPQHFGWIGMHRLYGPGEAKHRAELKRQRAGRHRNHAAIVLAHADRESPNSASLPLP